MVRFLAPVRDLVASYGQHASIADTAHRPWPLPQRDWFMGQSWFNLLFAHWRVDPDDLRDVVPPQLPVDVIDGSAWIAVTPFQVRALRLRYTPPLPVVSVFCELNVRTYVTVDGKPGICFLSLDAGSRLAVASARRAYRLPYFHAQASIEVREGVVHYDSARRSADGPPAALQCRYEGHGSTFEAEPDSVAASLIERYCAYTLDEAARVQRVDIHHRPWKLRAARAQISTNTMTQPVGIELSGEPMLHLAERQDVVIWPLEAV